MELLRGAEVSSCLLPQPRDGLARSEGARNHLRPRKKNQQERNRPGHCLKPQNGPLGRRTAKETGHNDTRQKEDFDAEAWCAENEPPQHSGGEETVVQTLVRGERSGGGHHIRREEAPSSC